MDLQSAGAGAGGGFLTALLTWFGFNKRIDKLEDGTVWRTTCAATHKAVDDRLERMENKIDRLLEK